MNPIMLFFTFIHSLFHCHACFQSFSIYSLRAGPLTRSVHFQPEILVLMWHASIENVKKKSFPHSAGLAFGFVWLRPGETELSNKNKSQINYGLEQGARLFVLALYALQTFCLQWFDSRRTIWMREWRRAKAGLSHADRDYLFVGETLRPKKVKRGLACGCDQMIYRQPQAGLLTFFPLFFFSNISWTLSCDISFLSHVNDVVKTKL